MKTFFAIALLIFFSLSHFAVAQKPEQLDDGIRVGDLKDFDEAKIADATKLIVDGTYPNIHSLLIFNHGKLVYENYFTGADRRRGGGRPLGG
jgi:hypothetical protein